MRPADLVQRLRARPLGRNRIARLYVAGDGIEIGARVLKLPAEQVEPRARELMECGYSIHFHVWRQRELIDLLVAVRERLGVDFDVELLRRNEHETLAVLRKLG